QAILSSKPEGDSKIQELRRRAQSLCSQDIGEDKKADVQQEVRDSEDRWTRVFRDAKRVLDQAERQSAVESQIRDYEALKENVGSWLEEKQRCVICLSSQTDPETTINAAQQTILSSKPEGDSKLTELRRQIQSLHEREDLEENRRREAEQAVKDAEERWRMILQDAEQIVKKAEVQYSISRELEAFYTQAGSTKTWVTELQNQADSKGSRTQGSQAQIESRLQAAQFILSSRLKGEAQVMELRRRAQSLKDREELQENRRHEIQQTVQDTEQQWRSVLQGAEEVQRELSGVMECLLECRCQRDQAAARLAELQKQTADLPRLFSWPGLGERRQAVEQTRTLLDQSAALAPVLSNLCAQAAELFQITQEPSWSEPSWASMEESIPVLLKELTEAAGSLEHGVLTERRFTQLVEQHGAAQDWLREHVKGLAALPTDRK
ncbi:hypothetical protein LDENG_00265980, partial [Lucifuga dentata]